MMASTAATGWAGLPPDLLDSVIGRLPFPADRARLLAVCRAWRSSARDHVINQQLPWIVLPDCTFCTTGGGGAAAFFHRRIPGVPDNAVCIGAAGGEWLALDCTDDAVRRVHCTTWDASPDDASPDVKHTHVYVLHNPFSNTTVPLPELDDLIGHVAETFEVRKVLARCPAAPADDVIAVTTNHWRYNVILCRLGKGTPFVLPYCRVIDVAFLGDTLYGITWGEELLAFHLGEDEDGSPRVTKYKLVIRNPLARYYKDGFWSWPMDYTSDADDNDNGGEHGHHGGNGAAAGDQVSSSDDEDGFEEDYDDDAQYQQGDEAWQDRFNGGCIVTDNESYDDDYANDDLMRRRYEERVPYEAEDEIFMGRYLVLQSWSGDELLLVRHRRVSSPNLYSYTLNVEVLRADASVGRWVPVTDGLAQGHAIYLSRSFSKCTPVYGGIQEGLVYYLHNLHLDDAFDMRSSTACDKTFWQPWQCTRVQPSFLTWLFPPQVVV